MTLPTWGGRSEFQYEGSVTEGTSIIWKDNAQPTGWSKPWFVTAQQYQRLLSNFSGQEMALGNYRDPVPGTIEAWLKEQEGQWGIGLASQLAQILIREGYAERTAQAGRVRFISKSTPNQATQYNTQPSEPVPNAPVARFPLANSAVETRGASILTLRTYFETADQQRRALEAAAARGWLDPSGNLDLYEASWRAFDSSSSAFSGFQNFEKIYNELKRPGRDGWNVFRPISAADCWPAQQIFETIKREFSYFSWRGPVTLPDFLNSGTGPLLESSLAKMQGIKPNQGYPAMAVSKFLHFSNPSLFPIYDSEVIWKTVLKGRFEEEIRQFCRGMNIPYENLVQKDTVAFLRYYMDWASSLMSFSHEGFMRVFVEWLGRQPGADLRQRTFDAATLYATAFEFTAIGATAVS